MPRTSDFNPDLIIVSAADAKFFPLLQGLVQSIADHAPPAAKPAMGVLDVGLEAEQIAWLETRQITVVQPEWDLSPAQGPKPPDYYKAFYCRPFLPKYFPGFATYLWLDADCWVQDWATIELYQCAAATGALAIVPDVDRAFRYWLGSLKIKYFMGVPRRLKSWIYDIYRAAYGRKVAQALAFHPGILNGAFALKADAPQWQIWAECYRLGLKRTNKYGLDLASLSYAIHQRGIAVHYLPAWCDWPSHQALPLWDAARQCLVEPYLPYQKIGILHLSNDIKEQIWDLPILDGGTIHTALTYPAVVAFNHGQNNPAKSPDIAASIG